MCSSFHTYDYARHFVSACTRILGIEGTPEGVEDQGRLTRVAAFPIGIDSLRFQNALLVPQVQEHIKELKERFSGRKVMLGVDRLDMIKGIPQKILAFEKFLEENPNWRDKVVLLQIAVPTRTDVPEYQKLTSQVHEIVGRINGRFGSLTAVPIHHLVCLWHPNNFMPDRSLDFLALCALYAVTGYGS
ncbi:alpha,alpha-trehalose-phosphate synthase [UDP-forming] 1-like [Gossypium australe]|uniref:Alpha,alpha-trehalose-phosphate synthase [UDP-forming] 1-like n=1 Tax=Gossypium australe TaxID=47621 RepID=A0A5B6VF00_9ROSI|nr:alpha,alpha-trehalose-phosphate synthase [UDP-forming] 1-like [Gossypium australe]